MLETNASGKVVLPLSQLWRNSVLTGFPVTPQSKLRLPANAASLGLNWIPPPRRSGSALRFPPIAEIEGRVTGVHVEGEQIVMTFGARVSHPKPRRYFRLAPTFLITWKP